MTTQILFHTPTKSADGTSKFNTRLPGSSGGNPNTRIGGNTRNGTEIIIPATKKALIKITAETDNTKAWMTGEYYEVTA